jgi:hypothetical protein
LLRVIRRTRSWRSIEAVRRAGGARLLVAGDPLEPLEPYRAAADGLDVEWRLGYLAPG